MHGYDYYINQPFLFKYIYIYQTINIAGTITLLIY